MDTGVFGALGFWIFLAAIIVAGVWEKSRREAEKHETLRRLVEKTGTIDEAKLKELFSPAEDEKSRPGTAYRALRITGTILMFLSVVPAILGTLGKLSKSVGFVTPAPPDFVVGMLVISVCLLVLGMGLFFSSRFAEPPPGTRNEPPTR